MKCLGCKTEEMTNYLIQTRRGDISYDVCEKCGGFWLDAGELDKLAAQVRGSIEESSADKAGTLQQRRKLCPRCQGVRMSKVFFLGYGDILLDLCDNCGGFWLDSGELDLINQRLKETRQVKGPGLLHFVKDVHSPYWHKRIRRQSREAEFKGDDPPLKDGVFKAQAGHHCPSCGASLNTYEAYGIEIEGCPKCKGLWLDKDELRRLKDKSEKGAWFGLRWMDDEIEGIESARAMASKRRCPKCPETELISTTFGHSTVIIDWCRGCKGTWLDRGEFEAIVESLLAKLRKLSAAELQKRLYQEIKEIWSGPENVISEILDAKAAIATLINMTIFEHPRLTVELLERFPPGLMMPRPW